uniref:DNA polymerase alpha subunit B N-terminal domain-containing protein n=1 Tax=Photinus pyralis TaxID=7054 RepID=A0A1Y1KGX7_PHOPY
MDNSSLQNDLRSCFELYGSLKEQVLEKCEQMCNLYNLTAEDLANEWGAYSASNLASAVPTLAALEGMERKEFAKRSEEFASIKPSVQTPTSTKSQSRLDERYLYRGL